MKQKRKRYDLSTRLEARRLCVHEGKSETEIAKIFSGNPTAATVGNWMRAKDEDGKTWLDERREYEQEQYERISPKAISGKILKRIEELLNAKKFGTKQADALAKMHKALLQIGEPKHQVPIMYTLLTEFVTFLKRSEYQKLLTKEFLDAVRDFRTEIRKKSG